nr:hypothetical protein [Tanacetum cinerariifolium]
MFVPLMRDFPESIFIIADRCLTPHYVRLLQERIRAPSDSCMILSSAHRDVESKAFFDSEISQLSLNQKKQHVFNVLNVKPLKITFLEFIELVIISTHSYPIQVLVVMPFDDLKFGDSDDSTFRVNISSRLPVDRSVSFLAFEIGSVRIRLCEIELLLTMDMTTDQQVALDEALVSHARRLKIGKSNFRIRSDITSKESTLQVVYDVLRLTLFYMAFLVTTDVPEIYMQEIWDTATVHHHSIRFKMNNKKRIVNLEYFREMMHICPRIPNQTFGELPFEEEILTFLRYIGHSGEINKITGVNINKLHQPWRLFALVISKCLSGKSTGYNSLRSSSSQDEGKCEEDAE